MCKRQSFGWCATFLLLFVGTLPAAAQQLAFPGAEGAGRYALGGRGGDVYYVTNLNDSGAGSLRQGIGSAPAAGRTILFKVSGTINLNSNLVINKPRITIAGQSAPGDGITIARYYTTVYQTSDVVLQHLRFRLGDSQAATNASDALWIQQSNNVMVDHVSASWSVDEGISTTGSDNVTVQWSIISEPLKNAGHPSGNHSYGSLINGGDITYHHNLYQSSDSRNPRPQGNSSVGTSLHLDFVNNVIQNPGGRYGYSGNGDTLKMNFVGNYGIDGPNTSASTLFEPESATTSIHFSGNFRDANKNGRLDGALATGNSLVSGQYASSATRFDDGGNLPAIASTSASQAYVQVVSRAGANTSRDSVDRRIIRNVINQSGAIINSQNAVGGYPTLTSGTAPADTNNDGVPDYYAAAQGYPVNQSINNVVAGNGYTHLQNYLSSLTPYAFPATNTQQLTVSTAFGRGADAQVNENRDDNGVVSSSGFGDSAMLNVRWTNSSTRNEYSLLRFDLAEVQAGSVTDAALQLTAFRNMANGEQVKVYGLTHDAARFDWDELSAEFATAPALSYDANPTTRGLDANQVYNLGQFSLAGESQGSTISFSNPNLAAFLNLAAYYEDTEAAGVVTLLLERTGTGNGQSRFASKEATALEGGIAGSFPAGTFAPRLVMTAVEDPLLPGDYNDDGIVDLADFVVWRMALGTATSLPNETETYQSVTDEDFAVWKKNFGRSLSGSGSSGQAVPEPTMFVGILSSLLLLSCCRRRTNA